MSLPAALSAFAAAFGVAALLVAAYARESRGSALEDTLDEVEAAAADPADDAARGRRR